MNRRGRRSALPTTGWVAVTALMALASWSWAGPTTDGVLFPGERFDEVMSVSGASKTVAVAALSGSFLTITCKAQGVSNAEPHLSVMLPDGQTISLGGLLTEKGRSAVVKKLPILTSGIHRFTMRTTVGSGGTIRFTAKAKKHPTSWRVPGEIEQDGGSAAFTFDALPASTLKLKVQSAGKPKWTPSVRVVSPSGADLDLTTLPGKASVWNGVPLAELGTYTVHVSGGVGRFKAQAKVRPPKRSDRTVGYPDVESLPEISGATPDSLPDDGTRKLTLLGIAFELGHQVDLFDGVAVRAFAPIATVAPDEATTELDLRGVPRGTYQIRINSPAGQRLETGLQVEVTNSPPAIGEVYPFDVPATSNDDLEIRGAGMDPGITVTASLVADGSSIPVTLVSHTAHDRAVVRLSNPDGKTGPVRFEVREPAGGVGVRTVGVDLLGLRSAGQTVDSVSTQNGQDGVFPSGAAYSDANGTVVVPVETSGDLARWVQFDHLTGQVLHTWSPLTPATGTFFWEWVQVVWNSRDDTWALTWHQRENNNTSRALMSIRKGDDLSEEVGYLELGSVVGANGYVGRVDATANTDDGGWLVTWVEHDGSTSLLKVQPVGADGFAAPADRRTLLSDPTNTVWSPTMVRQKAGRYLVVSLGVDDSGLQYALRSQVLNSRGVPIEPRQVAGTSTAWWGLYDSSIGVNPNDGTAVLIFTYANDDLLYRPAALLFDTRGQVVGQPRLLDAFGELPRGYVHAVVWNPDRDEFVMSSTGFGADPSVIVRRLTPTGAVKPALYALEFEGIWGYVYAGSSSGSLGLLRTNSGDAELPFDTQSDLYRVTAAPLR